MSNVELKELKNLPIEIIDGDRGIHYPPKTEFSKSGFCVFLNTGNVTASGFDFSTLDFIDEKRDSLLKKGKLRPYDIVLTTRGTVGNIGFFNETVPYKNIRINSGMVILRSDKEKIAPYYLYSFLKSALFRKQIKSQGSGSAQPQLPISSLKNISIPLVDFPIQQNIAAVLTALDSKIELNNRINAELEAMAKTLYDYWFVQFDFPDRDGKPYKTSGGKMVFNAELKREIPDGWDIYKLEDIVRCNYKSITKSNQYKSINYLDTSNLTENVIDTIQSINLDREGLPSRAQRIVKKDDILYSTVRPNQRHFGIIKEPLENLIASTGFAQLTSKIESIKNELIYLYLTSESTINRLQKIAVSSVSSYPSISPNDLLELKISLPKDDDILIKISSVLESVFDNQAIYQKQTKQLAELRDWLLPMLMNGQVVVKDER